MLNTEAVALQEMLLVGLPAGKPQHLGVFFLGGGGVQASFLVYIGRQRGASRNQFYRLKPSFIFFSLHHSFLFRLKSATREK